MLDLRNWTAGMWFAANALLFLVLLAVRFGSEVRGDFRAYVAKMGRRRRRPSPHPLPGGEGFGKERPLTMDEEKALYKRMEEARKRQVV
jgi:hypothetical protein